MKLSPPKLNKLQILTSVLAVAAALSYFQFSGYRPKVLVQLAEVRGAKTDEGPITLSYPSDYKIISKDLSNGEEKTTFKTSQSPEVIQNFYNNIFIPKGWEVETQVSQGTLQSTKYKKDKDHITVTTVPQEEPKTTVVSVEMHLEEN